MNDSESGTSDWQSGFDQSESHSDSDAHQNHAEPEPETDDPPSTATTATHRINYYNMHYYAPMFGSNDMELMRMTIGNKAASRIQRWWRGRSRSAVEHFVIGTPAPSEVEVERHYNQVQMQCSGDDIMDNGERINMLKLIEEEKEKKRKEKEEEEASEDDGIDNEPDMQIFVTTPEGYSITLNVSAKDTINKLKRKIHDKEGIPGRHQRLIFAEKHLTEGSRTLSECGIRDGGTVFLLLSLLGGGKRARALASTTSKSDRLLLLKVKMEMAFWADDSERGRLRQIQRRGSPHRRQ